MNVVWARMIVARLQYGVARTCYSLNGCVAVMIRMRVVVWLSDDYVLVKQDYFYGDLEVHLWK